MNAPQHHPFGCPLTHQTLLLLTPKPNMHPFIDFCRLNLQRNQRTLNWLGIILPSSFVVKYVLCSLLIALPHIIKTTKCKQYISEYRVILHNEVTATENNAYKWLEPFREKWRTMGQIMDYYQSTLPRFMWQGRREWGEVGGWARKQLDEQTVKNICIMTYLFHILSQLWIPIHIVTPAATVQCFPSATWCQDVSQDRLGNFGDDKNRQEQVEHDRVGCRGLGVLLPQRRLYSGRLQSCLWRGKNTGGSPGRMSVLGLEIHQTQFCFAPLNPAVLQLGGRWGAAKLPVGAL